MSVYTHIKLYTRLRGTRFDIALEIVKAVTDGIAGVYVKNGL